MMRSRRQKYRAIAGFTLIEALVATALMGIILTALSTVTSRWLTNWDRGFVRTQNAELVSIALDRLVADIAAAEFITANGDSSNLSVLDAETLQVAATIPLPGPPEFMATDAAGMVYVNIQGEPGKLVALDAKSLTVKATWSLPECTNPAGLALDAMHHRLFSVCENQVMAVTDSLSGRRIARVVIGRGPDAAAYDADLGLVFSSNGVDGTLTEIHQETPDDYTVLATVTTQVSARTMVLDPAAHRIYMAAGKLAATPPSTDEQPHPRPSIVPNSFSILVAQPK